MIIESFNTQSNEEIKSAPELYRMTSNPSIEKMSSLAGEVINIDKYVLYTDVRETGEAVDCLSIEVNGKVYASNSPSIIRTFRAMTSAGLMRDGYTKMRIVAGKSRAGRTFYLCEFVD